MRSKKLNPSYLSYIFYAICLLMFQIIIYELIHDSDNIELIWGSINIFLFFLIFLLIYSNHLMDKLNFINEYTTHHVITSLYEVNQFLKFFSKPDTILLKKLSQEFWQSDKAFDHFFIDKKNDLVHVYTAKKDHLKFIHLKRDLKELTCLSELEKNYQALLSKKSDLEQIIKGFPIPICELSKQHTIINQNDAFRTKIGNDVSLEEDTIFPVDIKISVNDQRNHWQFEKLSLNRHDFIIATDISLKDDLQKKLDTLENTYANLLDKLNISIGIFKHDTRLSIYNQTYLKTWGVTEKFIKTKPTLGEMIDHLRDIKILPELHNYEYFKQDRLELFKNLLTEKEEILYLPNEKIHRTIISPYPDGALMFIHEDISETYQMKSNLQSLENLANTVINDMDDLILIFSDNGRLRYFNTLKEEFKLFESIKFEKNLHISKIIKQLEEKNVAAEICNQIYQAAIESETFTHEFKHKNQTIQIHSKLLQDDSLLNRYQIKE